MNNNSSPKRSRPNNKFARPKRSPFRGSKPQSTNGVKTNVASTEILPEDAAFIKSLVLDATLHYVVLNKPSGLAVQSGNGVEKCIDNLLSALVINQRKKPKLVHRIDRETSGILIAAKNRTTAAFLSEQFAQKKARKTYYAIVIGQPSQSGIIDVPLKRGKTGNIDISVIANKGDKDAQAAETIFETLKTNGKISLVKLYPKTGRMHQLRSHLAYIGHPILGDMKYGGLLSIDGKKVPRLMLHAQTLEIDTGDGIKRFECPLPDDMNEWLGAFQ